MIKKLLFSLSILTSFSAAADGILVSWSASNIMNMTETRFNEAKKWKANDVLAKNLSAVEWGDVYLLLVAGMEHKHDKKFTSALVRQLTDKTTVKLQSTSRLIIWERIISGDILFEGKGMQIDDDLFSVAGRANFLLRNITGNNFGFVSIRSTAEELTTLQTKWTDYAAGKTVAQYENPFYSSAEGAEEIRSLSALEALIISLKPSAEKEALTKNCLRKMYGLDELPKEKNSPAVYCSPDTYTFSYLAMLTGDKTYDEKKNYEWWSKWWAENKSKLSWNAEKAIFEIR
jgi:hypothetical protein